MRANLIPKRIHQTWKTLDLPAHLATWSESWQRHHPGYEYRLWTDADIDTLIQQRFPEWNHIYQNYHQSISRIDLARYLILYEFGGVYADLDEECIRSIDSVIQSRQFVIGEEPASHLNQGMAIRRNMRRLLCPTVIASIPQHPFWAHLFESLRSAASEKGALDATGPFLLSRALESYSGPAIHVLNSAVFYPFDKFQIAKGSHLKPDTYHRSTQKAVGIHYWEGSWWREKVIHTDSGHDTIDVLGAFDDTGLGRASEGTAMSLESSGFKVRRHRLFSNVDVHPNLTFGPVILIHTNPNLLGMALSKGCPIATKAMQCDGLKIGLWAWEGLGSIPRDWVAMSRQFTEIWLPTRFCLEACADSIPVSVRVMPHAVSAEQGTWTKTELGIPEAAFSYLFMMDGFSNFDRKNPEGLIAAYRMAFPLATAEKCLVLKVKNLTDEQRHLLAAAVSDRSDILIKNETMSDDQVASLLQHCDAYLSLHRSEGFGLTIAEAMARRKPVIATAFSGNLDFMNSSNSFLVPASLVRLNRANGIYPSGTVWANPNLKLAASQISLVYADASQRQAIASRAAEQISMNFGPEAVGARMKRRISLLTSNPVARGSLSMGDSPQDGGSRSSDSRVPSERDSLPKVIILTPMRNSAAYLETYFGLLQKLDYPSHLLSLGILEGDSDDDTYDRLKAFERSYQDRFLSIQLFQRHHGVRLPGPRWSPENQRQRRSLIAQARNQLLSLALRDQDYVLWLDSDLVDYPDSLLIQLLSADKEIVVPRCTKQDGSIFDLNTFIFKSGRNDSERSEYLLDGLFQPPKGEGRLYLDHFQGGPQDRVIPIDSVGGTALLVRADVHRRGVNFPAWPHNGYIETEGFAMIAHELELGSFGMPNLQVIHADN